MSTLAVSHSMLLNMSLNLRPLSCCSLLRKNYCNNVSPRFKTQKEALKFGNIGSQAQGWHEQPMPSRNIFFSSFGRNSVETPEGTSIGKLEKLKKHDHITSGPPLEHFIANSRLRNGSVARESEQYVPYLSAESTSGYGRKVYFQTYGCQMNFSDAEIVWSVLQKKDFTKIDDVKEADVILVMTCAIREGAEEKIWKRLEYFKNLKRRRQREKSKPQLRIGILGCMAERLKTKIVEREKLVDVVCGPDAYRDLPRLLAVTQHDQAAVNVLLSLDETYADIIPVRMNPETSSAFVSIMRGCDNLCTYCIVPFTRGRERSRPMESILQEVKYLSDQGVKEVTLLGQNVNSYQDKSEMSSPIGGLNAVSPSMSAGFSTVYKPKLGGRRFSDLLDRVSQINPEMRIRFTSPHPKDFPDDVLSVIGDRRNICNNLHLPAQSGNNAVLTAMRRGYTREAYLNLVHHIRDVIPDVALSSDFISGFCGETEQAHNDTLSLIRTVQYTFAFCFPYSMREKTRAFHRLHDDVPDEVKSRRHLELVSAFREESLKLHQDQIGSVHLVLVEGVSKRSAEELAGKNDANVRVIFPKEAVPNQSNSIQHREIKPGDYVAVKILSASSQVLKGVPLFHTSLQNFQADIVDVNIDDVASAV
ncbi:mitochondrial tRNA methylthiotransferase CDK5RAP1-like [Gigantopelta aegis]|uniref:mitochondrial tRNA methylthiotransferase CDK5RAP1-like n=1 Tax=Gigantopelta aegis TaxID=1735272 RepID=UPI001B888A5A|nr:mitochondrial tRNA methylthiotransferase CDK5RAP1-like [Gigantopelta aegis]